jgi:FkbM family methyltransferase
VKKGMGNMSFISYAQNFEDVMLWRALKHVQNGFYVDVGAQHPIIDSVSKAFYEHGWRGIHFEPVPKYAELLRNDRPDETVFQVALSETDGTLELNIFPDTGISTAVNAIAECHRIEHGIEYERMQVPVLTLKSALNSIKDRDVHWLKIDVEGFEEKVLKGWDSQILRPWIIVVEATMPNSSITNYEAWESIIISANYKFVYFDGLNRFYVAEEHSELNDSFLSPPNVFDGVRLSGFASSELCRGLLEGQKLMEDTLQSKIDELNKSSHHWWTEAEQLSKELQSVYQDKDELSKELQSVYQSKDELSKELQSVYQDKDELSKELQSVYQSKSWKITNPLRRLAKFIRWFKNGSIAWLTFAPQSRPRRIARKLLIKAKDYVLKKPKLKAKIKLALKPFPSLLIRLKRIGYSNIDNTEVKSKELQSVYQDKDELSKEEVSDLSPRVQKIYLDLKNAVEEGKNKCV